MNAWDHPLLTLTPAQRQALKEIHLTRASQIPKRQDKLPYADVMGQLPCERTCALFEKNGVVHVGSSDEQATIKKLARQLMPWKKGPYHIAGTDIDAEWRCDMKWNRLAALVPQFKDKIILDIGCNNGYYLYRLALSGAKLALGIDPVYHVYAQWQMLQHFAAAENVAFGLWGAQDLEHFEQCFDVILSMGIIYHHRDPLAQLAAIRRALKPGGMLILESIGICGEESVALSPPDRYAQMSNVFFIPTLSCMESWCHQSKFSHVERLTSTRLTSDEQRVTDWSGPVSLKDFMHPSDPDKTVEGHPAPHRHLLIAFK